MTWQNCNYSVLPWYDNVSQQHWRKSYAQDQVWPLVCKTQRLPPFQVIRPVNDPVYGPLTSFQLIRVETGFPTEILANMNLNGLSIIPFTTQGYDIIVYTGQSDLGDITLPEGQYYAVMTDGTNTWTSEVFYMKADLSKMIYVKFWHDQPFIIPNGHIHYGDPFYNFAYFGLHERPINKPTYYREQEIEQRAGYEFDKFLVSRKDYRFTILMPEYMADLMRLIDHHHYVVVVSEGITYNTDRMHVTIGEWISQGHLVPVEFDFSTDTVVQTTGKVKPENTGHEYDQEEYDDSFS